jgi:lipoprotein NlpI
MPRSRRSWLLPLLSTLWPAMLLAQDAKTAGELVDQAVAAFNNGEQELALKLAGEAIAADPKSLRGYNVRARMHEALSRHREAITDLTAGLKLDPQAAELYQRRGVAQFKLGRFTESIADFDKYIELRPEQERSHWQRGISYYYAGRFDDGAKQFAAYQTFDDNDVENAVWRYLCMAREGGVEKARAALLKIKQDPRVPMMQVYALYKGELQPEDVLAAARAGSPSAGELNSRLFYAHLYLGLYYEVAGDAKLAREHITKAAEEHKIGHYMWDVARVHAELFKKP